MGILGTIVGNLIISGIAKAAIDELPGPKIEESPITDVQNLAFKALGNMINIWDTPVNCDGVITESTGETNDHTESTQTIREVATSIYDKVNHMKFDQVFTNHLND